jgi:hypothetical protein
MTQERRTNAAAFRAAWNGEGEVVGTHRRIGIAAGTAAWLAMSAPSALAAGPSDPPPPLSVGELCQAIKDGYEPFNDINGNHFRDSIECAAYAEVAQGGPGREPSDHYGPAAVATRAQMASFIARVVEAAETAEKDTDIRPLPAYDGQSDYRDVPESSVHAEAIGRLSQAGVVLGGPQQLREDEYGPGLPVTRAQMASFLSRVLAYMTERSFTSEADYFNDDDGSPHERAIDGIAEQGIAVGDGRDAYSPARSVPRDQMAAFLMRSLAALEKTGDIAPLPRTGEDTENIQVTPKEPATLTPVPNPDADNQDDRTFTVSGLNRGEEHRISLFPSGNVSRTADGQWVFADRDNDGIADTDAVIADITLVDGREPLDNAGDGTAMTRTAEGDTQTAVFMSNGDSITFVVDGDAAGEELYAVVHRNGGPDNRARDGGFHPGLELRDDGTPDEEWDIGGLTSYA